MALNPLHYLALIKTSVKRYIQIDLNYKFQIATDIMDLLLTIVAFAILGAFVDDAASPEELGINYNLQGFLFIGVFFWAFFQRAYEDTVETIPEEASRGTVGFLVTNNVNLSTLLISRNIASMVKTSLMALLIVLPILVTIDYIQTQNSDKGTLAEALEITGPEGSEVIIQLDSAYFRIDGDNETRIGNEGTIDLSDQSSNTLLKVYAIVDSTPGWQAEISEDAGYDHASTLLVIDSYDTGEKTPLLYNLPSGHESLFAGFKLHDMPLILAVFMLMWVFMLAVSVLIASFNILSKKVRAFAVMVLTLLKVISGFWFPIEAMQDYGSIYDFVRNIPIVTGLIFLRDIVLVDQEMTGSMVWDLYLQPILTGTIIVALGALTVYKYLERKSQRWGTLEFY